MLCRFIIVFDQKLNINTVPHSAKIDRNIPVMEAPFLNTEVSMHELGTDDVMRLYSTRER